MRRVYLGPALTAVGLFAFVTVLSPRLVSPYLASSDKRVETGSVRVFWN
jgi:hypothetical protein